MKTRSISYLLKCAAILAVTVFLLCGCDNGQTKENTDTVINETKTRITGELILDDSDDTVSEYPVTINDTVIQSSPERVICLSSSLTEMIYELGYGERMIGRGSYCDYPESVLSLNDYGKPASPNFDAIKKAAPDLLITATSIPSKDVTALSEIGIPVLYIASPRSVDEFGRIYCALGMVFEGLFDGEKIGNELYERIRSDLLSHGSNLGRFIYVTEDGFIAGGDTFESSVLSLFGDNAAADADGYGYDKSLLTEDQPDFIIIDSNITKDDLLKDDVLGKLNAVLGDNIISISHSYFESPSGRIVSLAAEIDKVKGSEQ